MDTFNEYLKKMCDSMNNASECLTIMHSALIHNSTASLNDNRAKIAFIKKTEEELAAKVTSLAQKDHSLKAYISIPQLISRSGENLEKLNETISKKIKEDLLFSDRAISELAILFRSLVNTLKSTSDLLATKNPVLVQHINENEAEIVRKALEYATQHEERLVEGLCLPVSSPLYLNMLNSIRCIAWDAKEMAAKFA